jgi:sortase A
MNIKNKKTPLFITVIVLLSTGFILTAKPLYHFIKRSALKIQSERRWESALKHKERDIKAAAWLTAPGADVSTLVLKSAEKEDLINFPIFAKFAKKEKVIIAHRDIHFNHLDKLRQGDTVTVQLRNSQIYSYRVHKTEIIDKQSINGYFEKNRENNQLAIVTCYPLKYIGPAPKRYIVWCKPVRNSQK